MPSVITRHVHGTPWTQLQVIERGNPINGGIGGVDWHLTPARGVPVHHSNRCDGNNCVIHSPSGHRLRREPLVWYQPMPGVLLRKCIHRNWHYDPDVVAYFERRTSAAFPNPDEFHALPWGPDKSIMGRDTPLCLIGQCCGCCGPLKGRAYAKWIDEVLAVRRRRFKDWRNEQEARKLAALHQAQEALRVKRDHRQNFGYTFSSTTPAYWVTTSNTTNGWIGSPKPAKP